MAHDQPFVDGMYRLEKYPGKGGWTYAAIPEIAQDPANPFGWVKVRGSIDGYLLRQYKLMPMGQGRLFLPVKAAIRKKIRKEAGDEVHIILYPDDSSLEIPAEIMDCFVQEPPELLATFRAFGEGDQKAYLDWIAAAKTEATRADRIVAMMDRLAKGLRWRDREEP